MGEFQVFVILGIVMDTSQILGLGVLMELYWAYPKYHITVMM